MLCSVVTKQLTVSIEKTFDLLFRNLNRRPIYPVNALKKPKRVEVGECRREPGMFPTDFLDRLRV